MKKYIYLIFLFLIPLSKALSQDAAMEPDTSLMSRELGEVVIKASKDNVTLKTIPASVSVISSKLIDDNEIKTLNEITSTVPNFYMSDYGSKLTSPVYIRGIGSKINSPAVGLYVDYVPYFEKAAFDFDFFDVKRIEVLRGPQGTLFGRNTMGGIVNIVTTSPVDYQGNHLSITGGNYGTRSINAGHYGKSGKLAWSLAGNALHNDGFYTNEYTGKKVDKLNSYGLRNRLIYELSDRFTIENIAGVELSKQGGYPYAVFVDSLNSAKPINYNQYSSYDRNLFSDALIARYNGSGFELMSTTSYQFLDDDQRIDQDFTADSLFFVDQTQNQHMFSQELVARSKGDGMYKWLFGGYGFLQQFNNDVDVNAWASKLNYLKTYDHTIKGAAFFHQSSVTPLKNFTLTAGIRIDMERDAMDYYYDMTQKGKYSVLADTLYPALKSLQVIPKFAVNYQLGTNSFYAVIARGYKTGGFNSTFERPQDLTFEPEYSWNYEAGIKTSFFNQKLYADISLFYIDWMHQQVSRVSPSGRGSYLDNAGRSASRGAEISVRTAPVKGYELMFSYGLTDAWFIDYSYSDAENYSGKYLPYVPRNTVSAQASKTIELTNKSLLSSIKISALYRGAGEFYWNEKNTSREPYYGLLDGKVSFYRGPLQLDLWAKNMLSADYYSFSFVALGNRYVQKGKPAQFGVNLSVKF